MKEFFVLLGLATATAIGSISGAVADADDRGGAALRGGATGLGLGLAYLAASAGYRAITRERARPPVTLNSPTAFQPFLNLDLRTRDQRLADAKRKIVEGQAEYARLTEPSA